MFHIRITAIVIILTSLVHPDISYSQNTELDKYHRSSIYSILLTHSEQKFAQEIANAFKSVPQPDKYNNHNLKNRIMRAPVLKKMSKEELEGAYKDAIHANLNRNKIGGRLVEKWFNRNKEDGTFDMNLIRKRGLYDASILDIKRAMHTIRGLSQLEDAGEELISKTYVLVNDIRYADATTKRNLQGFAILLGSMALTQFGLGQSAANFGMKFNELVVGFKVYVTSYLFQLDWNKEISDNFYSNLWTDSTCFDANKKALFDRQMGSFKLKYLGCTTVYSGETSLAGVEKEHDMFVKVCTRSIDKAISELQKSFDEFKVLTPLISTDPLKANIGLKEGVNPDSRYEVLEKSIDENGKTKYTRVGVIKPVSKLIWDNRFMASLENIKEADFGYTTFETVSGSGFYPGMLIRELR